MKVCVFTLGCKVNQYESDSIIAALKQRGYDTTEKLEFCQRYIINTCAVTGEAEKKSRQTVSKIIKINPNAQIYIIGCASQNNAEAFSAKHNVRYITGTAKKELIIEEFENTGIDIKEFSQNFEGGAGFNDNRTRAYIKVQDGCNNFCSYCIIPYLRGRSKSRQTADIRAEVFALASSGVKEIVITGINISDYGRAEGKGLGDLIEELKDADIRIRLGSLEEGIIDESLMLKLKALKQFCPHFHLSLQSGSDTVLRDMNRKYTAEEYLKSVELVRKHFPDAAITTDIICGFPTETNQLFEETVRFLQSVKLSDMHVFIYSKRAGTKAAELKQLDGGVVKARAETLNALKQQFKCEFAQANLNRERSVLIETVENGLYTGYTENYLKLYIDKPVELNCIYQAVPYDIYSDGAKARIVTKN